MNTRTVSSRLLFTLLVIVMIGALLAACAGGDKGNNAGEANESTSTGGTSGGNDKQNGEDEKKEIPVYDFYFVTNGYADQFADGKKPKYYDDVANEINNRLETERGFRLNFLPLAFPVESVEEKTNLELAAGKQVDLLRSNSIGSVNIFTRFVDKNTIIDLKPLLEKHGQHILKEYGQNAWDELTRDGKMYGIPQVEFPYGFGAWIRSDWLEKAGLSAPTTLAELENALRTFRDADFDGNGKSDTVPLVSTVDWLEGWFLGIFSDKPGDYLDNGAVKAKYEHPGYNDFLAKMRLWYEEGLIDDTVFDAAALNISSDLLSKNLSGVEVSNIFSLEWGPMKQIHDNRQDIGMKYLKPLTDMKAFPTPGISNTFLVIPTTSKNPEAVIQYLDWIYEKEENFVLSYTGLGIEGKTFVLGENNAPDLPQAEKDAGVKAGELLSGPYTSSAVFKHSIRYLPAATPAETRVAYDTAVAIPYEKLFTPAMVGVGGAPSEQILLKQKDADTVVREYIQKVITGDATYEELIANWKKSGGEDVYNEYTRLYQESGK